MKKLLLINGPNLNLLGTREPDKYGTTTLAEIETDLRAFVESTGGTLTTYQSNHEGDLVDRIQQAAKEGIEAVIINPGAYTHTSIAIRDAFCLYRSRLSKFIYPTFLSVRNSDTILTYLTLPKAASSASESTATSQPPPISLPQNNFP